MNYDMILNFFSFCPKHLDRNVNEVRNFPSLFVATSHWVWKWESFEYSILDWTFIIIKYHYANLMERIFIEPGLHDVTFIDILKVDLFYEFLVNNFHNVLK